MQGSSRTSSQEEDGGSAAAAGEAERQGEESDSSWGELQHATGGGQGAADRQVGRKGGDARGGEGGDEVGTDGANGVIQDGQRGAHLPGSAVASAGAAAAAEQEGGGEEEKKGEGGRRGEEQAAAAAADLRLPADAENDDADVVMVSPSGGGRGASDGGEPGNGEGSDGGAVGAVEAAAADAGAITRRPNLGALMTMLVVSLRMQRLVHWVVRKRCLDGLSGGNLVDLLAALEVKQTNTRTMYQSYVHKFLFRQRVNAEILVFRALRLFIGGVG